MEISISSLLDELQNIHAEDSQQLEEWCNKLCVFYQENDRHSYSEITKYIVSPHGGIEYMEKIIPMLKSAQGKVKHDKLDLEGRVGKLIDHIQLEIVRIQHIRSMVDDIANEKYVALANEQLESNMQFTQYFESRADELKERISDIEQKSQKAVKKVKKAESHSITILGIFASIVLAFTGGMVFSSSVLENIGNASLYRVMIIALIIGIVFFNLIWILLDFIHNINAFDEKTVVKKWPVWWLVNAVLVIGVVLTCVCCAQGWFDQEQEITDKIIYEQKMQNE